MVAAQRLKFLFLSFLLACLPAGWGQAASGVAFYGQAVTTLGYPAANALVRVCAYTSTGIPCTPVSLLYSDPALTTQIGNPLSTDQYGNYSFFVPEAVYIIQITPSPGITYSYLAGQTPSANFIQPTQGWVNGTAAQGATDTTLTLASTQNVPDTGGLYFLENEYESFTAVNRTTNVLSGVKRGLYGTTAVAHNANQAISVNFMLSSVPGVGVFGPSNGFGINNGYQNSGQPLVINSGGNQLLVTTSGTIQQQGTGSEPNNVNFMGSIQIGVPFGRSDGTNYVLGIDNTSQVVQDNAPHELMQPIGISQGTAGLVSSIPAPNIGAATLHPVFIGSGSCNITYVVTGVDVDGVEVPGTPVTINNLAPWGSPAGISIRYPSAAGVVSYNGYRTAVSAGCTGLATGKFASGITGNYGSISDQYQGGDSTSPPATNNSVAKSCVGSAANKELYCRITGQTATPPVSCGTSTAGWDFVNVNATSGSPALHCYSGQSSWSATTTTINSTPCELGGSCTIPVSGGSVTSVGISSSSTAQLSVSGSPVTGSGTIGLTIHPTGSEADLVTAPNPGTSGQYAIWNANGGLGSTPVPAGVTQKLVITSGICTTANTAYANCSFTVSWPTVFTSNAYAVSCSSAIGQGTNAALTGVFVSNKTTSGFQITLQNGDASGAGAVTSNEIDCIGNL